MLKIIENVNLKGTQSVFRILDQIFYYFDRSGTCIFRTNFLQKKFNQKIV